MEHRVDLVATYSYSTPLLGGRAGTFFLQEKTMEMSDRAYTEAVKAGILTPQEIYKQSKLPRWCLTTIASLAYKYGHSEGQEEVDNIGTEMIHAFEEAMGKGS